MPTVTRRLASALQIRPGEGQLVILVAALFACVEAGRGLGANAADALFFLRFGVDNLPYMFMALGAANFVVSLSYTAGLGRFPRRRFFSALPATLAGVIAIERLALAFPVPALYPAIWISVNILSAVLGLMVWNVAGEVCDARQAKRLFALFVSASILGGVAGNFITGPAASALGVENLLIVYALLLLAGAGLTRRITRQFFRASSPAAGASFLKEVRAGFDFVRRSPMFQLMAVAAVLFSILYFSISFPFSKAVSAAFGTEAQVAGFLGLFSGIATAATFAVSLFVANRLYARVGVVNAVLLLPVVYFAGFVLMAADYTLASAALARLTQLVTLGGLAGTAYSTFFNVVPPDRRGQVRSFDSGVPEQIGVALSGGLLILGERALAPGQIFVTGMLAAAAAAWLVWRMRSLYGAALIDALRAGRVEVFSAGDRAFAGFRGDASAIRTAVRALYDARPSTRRLAAEILGRMQATAAADRLARLVDDLEPEVRVTAIRALADLKARPHAADVFLRLGDDDPAVRAAALRALPGLHPSPPPALRTAVERMLSDADAEVRAEAAVALARLGAVDAARQTIDVWLRDARPEMRARALRALSDMPPDAVAPTLALQALGDPSAIVRRAASRALARRPVEAAADPLIDLLCDRDSGVRAASAAALRALGVRAAPSLLQLLQEDDVERHAAALDALEAGDFDLLAPLSDYARREIDRARRWRALRDAIPEAGRLTRLLRDSLSARIGVSEQRLVKTVGLLGNPEAMSQVARGLRTRNPETRAAAIEALETLGHQELARLIVPLLDESPPVGQATSAEAIAALAQSDDGWLRALAAGAIGELRLRDLAGDLRALGADADALVSQTARQALARLDGEDHMETLQTISTMERILVLREVPLFAGLSPDDLKQIADIAREQWYSHGEVMCRQGDEGHELFVLVSGKVRVSKTDAGGAEKFLAVRQAGDFIGEMAIVESAPRSATVRAEGEARALVIEGEAFKSILRDRSEVSLAVLRGLSRRLRERE